MWKTGLFGVLEICSEVNDKTAASISLKYMKFLLPGGGWLTGSAQDELVVSYQAGSSHVKGLCHSGSEF